MNDVAPEYIRARCVLLDVLELLEGQRAGLVLVGAQAVYLHAPAEQTHLYTYTLDGDLALDPDLLAESPNIGQVLIDAGYTEGQNPGTFFSPSGIEIDFMVPDGALPPPARRTAILRGQSPATARRTVGIEIALIDTALMEISSLDPTDDRRIELRVAGPAALAISKLIKIEERTSGSRRDRVVSKDAGDYLRLLRYCDAEAIGHRLRELSAVDIAAPLIERATRFLASDLQSRPSQIVTLTTAELDGAEPAGQVETAVRTLSSRLLEAFASSV